MLLVPDIYSVLESKKLCSCRNSNPFFYFYSFFFLRFLLGVIAGYFWYIAVAFIFYMTTGNLADDWELIDHSRERMDGDLLEFYDIGRELENGELESERGYGVMAERVIVVYRVGRVGCLWVFPALGIIWGFSQERADSHVRPFGGVLFRKMTL